VQRRKTESYSPIVAAIGVFLAIATAIGEIFPPPSRGETEARRRTSDSFSRAVAIGIFLAIVTAAVGYVVGIADDRRKREIAFVDQQIEKLYGPPYALSLATLQAKEKLFASRNHKTASTDYFDPSDPPTAQDVERWRLWMKTIFQPMNELMEETIVKNAQLVEGVTIYDSFLELIFHVESYKVTIAKWKDTDAKENPHFTEPQENVALSAFPTKFDRCVEKAFLAMSAKRDRLKNSWFLFFRRTEDRSFGADC
jgi:hypothetical protein